MRRRLDSFNKSVGVEERIVVLDKFSQKMINSGHQMKVVRSIKPKNLRTTTVMFNEFSKGGML